MSENNPIPLEQTDPELAGLIARVANGEHSRVRSFAVQQNHILFVTHDKNLIVKKRNRPGRNEPCDCGSGKKYKNCCLT